MFKTFNKKIHKPILSLNKKSIKWPITLEGDLKEEQNNIEIKEYNEKNVEAIKKKFQEIYEQKKIKWKKEDILMGLKKEKEMQNIFEIENFLFEVQNKNLLKKNKNKYN